MSDSAPTTTTEGSKGVVENVARAIAKTVMRGGDGGFRVPLDLRAWPDDEFDPAFERLWDGRRELDQRQREFYRVQACAAVKAVLLELKNRGWWAAYDDIKKGLIGGPPSTDDKLKT